MLRNLSVRDVVLIDRLELAFHEGLTVLTGETGAGKSILLDALGLALGSRADARLLRPGRETAQAVAEFVPSPDHACFALLAENGIDPADGNVILRRSLGADGRSRAFVNDQAVSIGFLKRLGDTLVEIHGQFESQRLLDATQHRALLDAFGGLGELTEATAVAWRAWRAKAAAVTEATEALAKTRREEAFLRHAIDELRELDPQSGEELALTERRAIMMSSEKLAEALAQATAELDAGRGVEGALRAAERAVQRLAAKAGGALDASVAALGRAATEVAEARAQIEKAVHTTEADPTSLEQCEARLFALRAAARKFGVGPDELAALRLKFESEIAKIEDGDEHLRRLAAEAKAGRATFVGEAQRLTAARSKAARRLEDGIAGEIEPLRLGRARFSVRLETMPDSDWGEYGAERVAFQAATNPGMPPGPLAKIASGGELARFMLALKAVLAATDPVSTLVFDEVDSGVGGAVAAAVGQRLADLATGAQVLVVTHSPQVAARGAHHLRVAKDETAGGVATKIEELDGAGREDEIARMLSGEKVTAEARAAAASLLATADSGRKPASGRAKMAGRRGAAL